MSGEGDRDDVVRAVDSGLVVLKTLHGLPMVQFVVYHPGVEVYADAAGQQVRQDVKKAVIIEQVSADGNAGRVHRGARRR